MESKLPQLHFDVLGRIALVRELLVLDLTVTTTSGRNTLWEAVMLVQCNYSSILGFIIGLACILLHALKRRHR